MAKDTTKKKKVTDNSEDFDKEFEELFEDEDFDGNFDEESFYKETEDDRTPTYKGLAKEVITSAAEEGATSFSKRLAKKALPIEYDEYSYEAISLVDFTRDVFDKSKEQLRKPISRFATEVKKLTPQSFTTINKILDTVIGEKEESGQSQEQLQEAAIASTLSSIFDKQIEVQKTLEANRISREEAERKVEFKTLQKNSYYLSAIQAATETQTSFTLNVAKDYYKKSLELQFRSYYVQADLLKTTKDYFKGFSLQLDNITKNTSLPDALKIKANERFIEEIKKRTTNAIYARFIDSNEYLNRVKENIARMVQYKISDIADRIDSAASAISDLTNLSEMGGSVREIVASLVGSLIGGKFGETLADKIAPKVKDRVRENTLVRKGAKFLSALGTSPQTLFQTLPDVLRNIKETADSKTGIVSSIVSGLAGKAEDFTSVFDVSGTDVKRKFKQDITTLKEPAIFDQLYHRSVTQVIPLYLAHILRENTIQSKALLAKLEEKERNDIIDDTPILSYDFNQNKLVTTTQLATSYTKFIKSKLGLQKTQYGAERIISAIESENEKVNPIEREAFIKSIEALKDSGFDMSRLDFDKIEKDSALEKELKGILGDKYRAFEIVLDKYRKIKEKDKDKGDKVKKKIEESIKYMGDNPLINILRNFMKKFFNLPFLKTGIKGYVIEFTDKELESISYSILKSLIERPSESILPKKSSLMFFLKYVKPLDNEKENEDFKKKLSIWINISDMVYKAASGEEHLTLVYVYGELNSEIRKIAQSVNSAYIEHIFEANPVLNINPDKDMPDWRIIYNGDFLAALNSTDNSYLNVAGLPNNIDKELQEFALNMTRENVGTSIDKAQEYLDNIKRKLDVYAGRGLFRAKRTLNKIRSTTEATYENIRRTREELSNARTPQEIANILQRTLNDITRASIEVAKSSISAIRGNFSKLLKQLEGNLASPKTKSKAIDIIDGIIGYINGQIEDSKKTIEELQSLINNLGYSEIISDEENNSVHPTFMDQYTQLQKRNYEIQIKMNQKGIEALEKVISQLNEIKESINSITEGTIENKLSDIIGKAKTLVEGIGEKLKNIENMYEKELENIRKAEEKLKPNK